MATKNAGEVMVPIEVYPHIPYWATLREAVEKLEESILEAHGKSSLPRAGAAAWNSKKARYPGRTGTEIPADHVDSSQKRTV